MVYEVSLFDKSVATERARSAEMETVLVNVLRKFNVDKEMGPEVNPKSVIRFACTIIVDSSRSRYGTLECLADQKSPELENADPSLEAFIKLFSSSSDRSMTCQISSGRFKSTTDRLEQDHDGPNRRAAHKAFWQVTLIVFISDGQDRRRSNCCCLETFCTQA